MKTVNRWLLNVALAIVVAGSVAQANAAIAGTAWTDEAGFLSRMSGNPFFTQDNPVMEEGTLFIDDTTDYGYQVLTDGDYKLLFFTAPPNGPAPTGVGGVFSQDTTLTFYFSDSTSIEVPVTAGGFGGYTTDVKPNQLSIGALMFKGPAPTKFHVGLDTVIPEPSTIVAGVLLLFPFAASTVRRVRRKLQ